jgi:hypothetical protein
MCGDGSLADLIWVNRNLIVAFEEINFGEDGAASGDMSKI